MQRFTFYVDPFGFNIEAVAETMNQAHKLAFDSLPTRYKDNLVCLDWIDTQPTDATMPHAAFNDRD